MGKATKIIAPILAVVGLAVVGWLILGKTGNSGRAEDAAGAVIEAADEAIGRLTANARYSAEKQPNYVNIGAIYTATGNVKATLVVRGTNGVEAVCNRMAHVRDYLVVLLSDHPPDPANLRAGPTDFDGSVSEGLNRMLGDPAVSRVRFDSFELGSDGGASAC